MASNIQIKRSGTTVAPTELLVGEMAYSWASGSDKLYIGAKGVDGGTGFANDVVAIGGEYFTAKLDHTPGTLTANSAILVDNNSKIDVLNIDNITIDGNTISSTDTNGNIVLSPNGSGSIDASTSKIINLTDPTGPQDASTKNYVDTYVDSQFSGGAAIFNIAADSGTTDTVFGSDTVTFSGGGGITTTVSNNAIQIDPSDFTITLDGDATGSVTITDLGSANLSIQVVDDSHNHSFSSGNFTVNGSALTVGSGTNSSTIYMTDADNSTRRIQTDIGRIGFLDTALNWSAYSKDDGDWIVVGNLGVGTDTPSSELEVVGNITATRLIGSADTLTNARTISLGGDLAGSASFDGSSDITITATIQADSVALGTDTTGSYVESLVEGTGVTITNNSGEGATPTIAIGQDVSTTADVRFNDMVLDGDLTVNGTTTTFKTNTITVEDPLIFLGSNNAADILDLGWVGQYNDGVDKYAGVFRNSTDKEFYVFDVYTTAFSNNNIDTTDPSFSLGVINAETFRGALDGNAGTADALSSAVTVELTGDVTGSATFTSAGDTASITTTIAADSVALGTDTTGDYVESVAITAGTGLSISGTGEGANVVLAGVDATTTTKGVASFTSDNFSVTSGEVAITAIDGGTF